MNGTSHLIYGIALAESVETILEKTTLLPEAEAVYVQPFVFFAGAIIGSLFPDVDDSDSKLGRKLGLVSELIESAFGHRGIFHDSEIWPLIFAAALLNLANNCNLGSTFLFAFTLGVMGHLFLDGMTGLGLNRLLTVPFTKKVRFLGPDATPEQIAAKVLSEESWLMSRKRAYVLPKWARVRSGGVASFVLTVITSAVTVYAFHTLANYI